MKTEKEIIDSLSSFGKVSEDRIDEFEKLIYEVSNGYNKNFIKYLLLALDDDCEFDEVMFGVIHTLERFPRQQYFEELGKVLPELSIKALRWCKILHTRIMNSPSANDEYLKTYVSLNSQSRNALISLFISLSSKEKFRDSCAKGIKYIESLDPV